jgi:acyl-CoA synthetase (AMP-forming)/AMP-acid ligase II
MTGDDVTVVEEMLAALARTGEAPAVLEVRGERLLPCSGRQLLLRAQHLRRALRARGIGPGDRVVLLASNSGRPGGGRHRGAAVRAAVPL